MDLSSTLFLLICWSIFQQLPQVSGKAHGAPVVKVTQPELRPVKGDWFCVVASGFPEVAAHAALVTQGRAGTFNDVVDGAGCKLVGVDYHRMIATGWPVAQLPKFHWDDPLLPESCIYQRCEPDINTPMWSEGLL